jgi:hypothetical protein
MFYWAVARLDLFNGLQMRLGKSWFFREANASSANNKAVISINHRDYIHILPECLISPTRPYWGYYGCIIRFPASIGPFGYETA